MYFRYHKDVQFEKSFRHHFCDIFLFSKNGAVDNPFRHHYVILLKCIYVIRFRNEISYRDFFDNTLSSGNRKIGFSRFSRALYTANLVVLRYSGGMRNLTRIHRIGPISRASIMYDRSIVLEVTH